MEGRLAMMMYRLLTAVSVSLVVWSKGAAQDEPPRPVHHRAHLLLENGAPFTTNPQILVEPGCSADFFRTGTIGFFWTDQVTEDTVAHQGACVVRIMLAGYRTVIAQLEEGTVVTMKRLGENEGSSVSLVSLSAPKDAKKAFDKGWGEAQKRHWQKAQADYEDATRIYPQYASAWSELGKTLEQQQKSGDAMAAYRKAIEADPKYIKPYVQLAAIQARQKQWRDTLDTTARAVKLNPIEFPGAYYYRGVAHFELGDFPEADKDLKSAIDIDVDGQFSKALVIRGYLLEKAGKIDESIEMYRLYLRRAPKAPDSASVLARVRELEAKTAANSH